MRIALIVPYFGRLPDNFQLVLNSCEANCDEYDWIFFTDDKTPYRYPLNVKVYYLAFQEFFEYVQSRFDFSISLNRPYKLCDYRPAYGYIFSEYLEGYDFWGHCDIDCIFGRFSDFIKKKAFENDKLFRLGHLTMYRNTPENNARFRLPIRGVERYREVFSDARNCIFDEDNAAGELCIEDIWREYGFSEYTNDKAIANTWAKGCIFVLVFQREKSSYQSEKKKRSIFYWADGKIIRLTAEDGRLCSEEYLYIHLINRKMKNCIPADWSGNIKIIPNAFEVASTIPKSVNEFKHEKWFHFNNQYIKVRSHNLKVKVFKFLKKNNERRN